MKWINYKINCPINTGPDEAQVWVDNLQHKTMSYSEGNLAVALSEAYNGEYTIEDDGQPDPAEEPTQLDIIEAQVTYTAMMTDTMLEV